MDKKNRWNLVTCVNATPSRDGIEAETSLPEFKTAPSRDGIEAETSLPEFRTAPSRDGIEAETSLPKFSTPPSRDGTEAETSLLEFRQLQVEMVWRLKPLYLSLDSSK